MPHFPSSSASSDSCPWLSTQGFAVPRSQHPNTDCFHGLGLVASLCCVFAPPFLGGAGEWLWAVFNMHGLILRDLEIVPKQVLKDTIKIYKNMIMNTIITAC